VDELADGVWHLGGGVPRWLMNVYLLGDVLLDAATRQSGRRIVRQLKGRDLSAHMLTHAHSDHQGASRELCETFGIPFWVGAEDADAAERPELILERQPDHPVNRFVWRTMAGPGRRVDRRLREGDEVAGFELLHTPGHSAGHMALWRERDGVLICGDVLANMDTLTGARGLREPKEFLSPDPARNRDSARRLAALKPNLVLFGHGPPLTETMKLAEFVDSLPA
jgi:hydroxyacylglutathione hydrolase